MGKKITIVGAGLAGLAAGCYARMNGYEAEIYESHTLPGGLCTAWKRDGYTFDGCLHWLTGSGPKSDFYPFWQELGALKGRAIHDPDCFYRFVTGDGRTVSFYSDADKLARHLEELSPEDAPRIRELKSWIKQIARVSFPMDKPFSLFNVFDFARLIWKMMPHRKLLNNLTSRSIGEYARNFRDPALRDAFTFHIDSRLPLMGTVVSLATLHNRAGGFPLGGSLEFARAIERRFFSLGGQLHYQRRVEKVLLEQNRAVGLRLENGEEIRSDFVISAADLHFTLNHLLDGQYTDPIYQRLFEQVPLQKSGIQVSLGLRRTFGPEDDCVGLLLPVRVPFNVAGEPVERFTFRQYGMDPGLAPAGCTSAIVTVMTDTYEYWENLYRDKEAYKKEKERIQDMVLQNLEYTYPGISAQVETSDVATPMTYHRYTGNWRGKYMTWITTGENQKDVQQIPLKLSRLDGFYMAGMWLMAPGGVPSAVKTARDAIQLICRSDRKKFQTTKDV